MATLQITDLHVQIATENGPKEILKGLSLTIETGETHAIMGPNGSGKSTLASTIAGHPRYEVTSGSITLDGEDVLEMSVDERAQAGPSRTRSAPAVRTPTRTRTAASSRPPRPRTSSGASTSRSSRTSSGASRSSPCSRAA